MKTVALCYLRKSLVKSGSPEPASPALQRELTGKAAATLGLTAEFYEDATGHSSGHTQDRPGWQTLAARLADRDVAAVIVHTWDRAARNTKNLLQIADDCEAAGVRFVSVADNIDTRTAGGRFQLTIIAGVGEYESNASSERRVATIDFLRRAKGRHYGTAPFGTERVKQGGDLVLVPSSKCQPNGTDHAALVRAYELYGAGRLSLRRACLQLNAEGWRWRMRDGALALWSAEALRRTLANHMLYAGYVSVGRAYRDAGHELLKGSHGPLLPTALLDPIAATFAAYRQGSTRRVPMVYPLTGVLYCARCGQRLQGASGRDYRAYKHPLPCGLGRNSRSADVIERDVRAHLAALNTPAALDAARQAEARQQLVEGDGGSTTAEHRRVEQALENLRRLFTWGDLDADAYQAQKAAITASLPAPVTPTPATAALLLPSLAEMAHGAAPAELMALVRLLYTRIELDGEALGYRARGWCAVWA